METTKTQFIKDIWTLIAPFWKSKEKWIAFILLIVIISLNLGQVYINVLINKWNNTFYNTLQNLDKKAFLHQIFVFCYLAAIFIIIAVYSLYLNQMLSIRWRRWLTEHYLSQWLTNQNYYRMQLMGKATDNPDQRISEDIGQFITLVLSLSLGLLSAAVTLVSFLAILWQLSGTLTFHFHGNVINISGYMVWLALIYAIAGTALTTYVGKPLIPLSFNQQRVEADFRYSMVRLREYSESVAFFKGEAHEKQSFLTRFKAVFDNYWQIMKRQKTITWFVSGYNQFALIFPIVIVAPRFFSGKLKLGGLMQTVLAFGQVQTSLSYIVNSFTDIATWKATTDRLITFTKSMRFAEALSVSDLKISHNKAMTINANNLTVLTPDGRKLLENVDFNLGLHDSLLIVGKSGCGKTTLLRTLAGIWPFAKGTLSLPEDARMMFLPQKPYFPLGNLRQVLLYLQTQDISEDRLLEMLELCQLEHLRSKLDQGENWSRTLSLGEQQRISFVRAILSEPDFLFLDEATSALDEPSEANLYKLLKTRCINTCLISVGHRSTLKTWHKQIWDCEH